MTTTDTNQFPMPPRIPVPVNEVKQKRSRKMVSLIVAGAVLAGGGGTAAYFLNRGPSQAEKEATALSLVREGATSQAITSASDSSILGGMRQICSELGSGKGLSEIADQTTGDIYVHTAGDQNEYNQELDDAGLIEQAAINNLCPKYVPQLWAVNGSKND